MPSKTKPTKTDPLDVLISPGSSPLPEGVVTSENLGEKSVPEAEPQTVDEKFTLVNLKRDVFISGVKYGRGEGVLVPTDAFDVWRHAV